jgi:Cyclin, N-terminal domain
LVGITCLLVAGKYEETQRPLICDCLLASNNLYTKEQITDMEMKLLFTLDFVIGRPLPLRFLKRLAKSVKVI